MAGKSEARRNRKLAGIACLVLFLGIGGVRGTVLSGSGCAGSLLSAQAAVEAPVEGDGRDAHGAPVEGDPGIARERPAKTDFRALKDQGIPLAAHQDMIPRDQEIPGLGHAGRKDGGAERTLRRQRKDGNAVMAAV